MNSEQPQSAIIRETPNDADSSDSGKQSGLWHWVQNWPILLLIVLPGCFGAILAIAGDSYGSRMDTAIVAISVALQLASFLVAAIWVGLGRRTLMRSILDWSILMLLVMSIWFFQFAWDSRPVAFMSPKGLAVGVAVYFVIGLMFVVPFLFFRNGYEFSLPGHKQTERLTILDLLTATTIVAICLGIIRTVGVWGNARAGFDGDFEPAMGIEAAMLVSVIYVGISVIVSFAFALFVGMPLIIWARCCRRNTRFWSLAGWCLAQFGLLVFSVVSVIVMFVASSNEPFLTILALFGIVQATIFLLLIAIAIIRFPQGDLMDSESRT